MALTLFLIGLIFCFIGVIGSVAPVLPGLPLSWIGILLLYFVPGVPTDYWMLGITFVITLIMFVLGYVIPAKGTKKFGGSKAGTWGTTIGLIVGIFFPFGILIGPFLGALIGEIVFNQTQSDQAIKAAFGSFLGLLISTFMHVIVALVFLFIFCYKVWAFREFIF